jgi:hypothetical protein
LERRALKILSAAGVSPDAGRMCGNETLNWLEQAYEQRSPRMIFLKVEPKWNNLRANSRFADLLRRGAFP